MFSETALESASATENISNESESEDTRKVVTRVSVKMETSEDGDLPDEGRDEKQGGEEEEGEERAIGAKKVNALELDNLSDFDLKVDDDEEERDGGEQQHIELDRAVAPVTDSCNETEPKTKAKLQKRIRRKQTHDDDGDDVTGEEGNGADVEEGEIQVCFAWVMETKVHLVEDIVLGEY